MKCFVDADFRRRIPYISAPLLKVSSPQGIIFLNTTEFAGFCIADTVFFIPNTHEPIIDQETFDNVQRLRSNIRRYPDGWGDAHPLSGLLYCADCGSKMYVHRTNNGKRISQFTCAAYSKIPVGQLCKTQHRINADVVMKLISETLREIVTFSEQDEAGFRKVVQDALAAQQSTDVADQKKRLEVCRSRMDELEKMLCRIYEDNALGKLPDKRYGY